MAALNVALSVLELTTSGDVSTWTSMHDTYGTLELQTGKNIFSAVAMSAQTIKVTLRPQTISLRNAIRWGDKTLFITSVDAVSSRYQLTVAAADVAPVTVTRTLKTYTRNEMNNPVVGSTTTQSFPAWLSEKYVKYEQPDPAGKIETCLVLIVPKAAPDLAVGDIITVSAKNYAVEICHTLDPDKNEYEIVYRGDA